MRISDWSSDVCSSDLGLAITTGGDVVELWGETPFVEHADDAERGPVETHAAANAVAALEQAFVQGLGNHHHARAACILGGAPASSMEEGNVEHREEVGAGEAGLQHEWRQALLEIGRAHV